MKWLGVGPSSIGKVTDRLEQLIEQIRGELLKLDWFDDSRPTDTHWFSLGHRHPEHVFGITVGQHEQWPVSVVPWQEVMRGTIGENLASDRPLRVVMRKALMDLVELIDAYDQEDDLGAIELEREAKGKKPTARWEKQSNQVWERIHALEDKLRDSSYQITPPTVGKE